MSKGGREREEGGGASKLPEFDSLHMCHGESDSGRLQSRVRCVRVVDAEWWTCERSVVEWERSIHVLQFDSQFSDEFACHTSCGKLGH